LSGVAVERLARCVRNGHVTGVAHTVDALTNNTQSDYMHLRSIVIVSDKIRKKHLIRKRQLLKLTSELRLAKFTFVFV